MKETETERMSEEKRREMKRKNMSLLIIITKNAAVSVVVQILNTTFNIE